MLSRSPGPRGAALILAMLFAALAATIAVAVAAEQQRWFASVTQRRDQVEAQSLALAGVQWARQILYDDARSGTIDYLGEPWSYPLPPTPLENGSIEGRIEDAQGRVNLNNLVRADALGLAHRAWLTRLLLSKGISAATLDAIADWIDSDTTPRTHGAEDAVYLRDAQPGGQPALTANAPLVRIAEIAAIHDIGPARAAVLAPLVVALPSGTALNVNTAAPEILAAALPGLAGDLLNDLVADRARKPFTTLAEFRARLPPFVLIENEAALGVASSYFVVTVRARQGDVIARVRALVKRDSREWPAVVWQTLE